MKSFNRAVDSFCRRHRSFGIPRLMLYIVIASVIVFILAPALFTYLIFDSGLIMKGQIWRLVTWIFLPVNSTSGMGIFFTAIMLYFYYYIGSTLEQAWGTGRFTAYYLSGMFLHVAYSFITYFAFGNVTVYINPIYLNLSMFFAFATLNPDHMIRLFMIIPIKMKWAAIANALYFLYNAVRLFLSGYVLEALLPFVALLSFVLFCGEDLLSYLRASTQSFKRRTSPNIINYKKEAKRAKRDLDSKPYRHKCAVCGKTDTDSPDMEFRYCSRCAGYHCFCSEHINSHIHFS